MIYREWMKYIRDEVPLTKVIIPSAHNAGSYGMAKIACCQDGDIYTQFRYGIRHFCMRLDTVKGKIVLCHGIKKGHPFIEALADFKKIIEETDSEFMIIDLREYQPQKVIGNWVLHYHADPKEVDALLKEYIEPEKYAFTDFDDIDKVTMGDIRKSGKKYLLINHNADYAYSVNCAMLCPWNKIVHGRQANDFVRETMNAFEEVKGIDGLYWFQTQQTPNAGTDIGMRYPRTLDRQLRGVYDKIIESIANNPSYLERANIISGDFMTEDYMKCRSILMLNILKNNVIPELEGKYLRGLWRH